MISAPGGRWCRHHTPHHGDSPWPVATAWPHQRPGASSYGSWAYSSRPWRRRRLHARGRLRQPLLPLARRGRGYDAVTGDPPSTSQQL